MAIATNSFNYNTTATSTGTITVSTDTITDTIYTTTAMPGSITVPVSPSNTFSISTEDLNTCKYMQVGSAKLTEQDFIDILDLVKTINELDDSSPIKEMYENIKMLNKIKGEK